MNNPAGREKTQGARKQNSKADARALLFFRTLPPHKPMPTADSPRSEPRWRPADVAGTHYSAFGGDRAPVYFVEPVLPSRSYWISPANWSPRGLPW